MGRSLGPFVSPQVLELIQEQMRRLANNENGGLLTFGVAGALWSSSAALVSMVIALGLPAWAAATLVGVVLTVAGGLLARSFCEGVIRGSADAPDVAPRRSARGHIGTWALSP